LFVEGCQNSPAFQSRLCEDHKRTARSYIDEGNDQFSQPEENEREAEYLAIQKILSDKSTRQGKFYEVRI
jgi:hypothetical protein